MTSEQRALDYEYRSVDEDEDGFPDEAPGTIPVGASYANTVIRVTPAVASETYATTPIVRVVPSTPAVKETYGLSPVVFRVAEEEPEQPTTTVLLETTHEGVKQSTPDSAIIPDVKDAADKQTSVVYASSSDVANQKKSSNLRIGGLDGFLSKLASSAATYQKKYHEPTVVAGSSTEVPTQGGDSIAVDAFGFLRII